MRGYGNFKKNWANSWKEEGLSYSLRSGRRTTEWEEMSRFAARLRGKRASLGLTQGDVGAALGRMTTTGGDFSQTTISRFEKLNLSLTNMLKLRPALEKWLQGGAITE